MSAANKKEPRERYRLVKEREVARDKAGAKVYADDYVGRTGVWSIIVQNRGTVTQLVKVVDARKMWNRVDLLIETNTGDRVWVSDQTVKIVEPPDKTAP